MDAASARHSELLDRYEPLELPWPGVLFDNAYFRGMEKRQAMEFFAWYTDTLLVRVETVRQIDPDRFSKTFSWSELPAAAQMFGECVEFRPYTAEEVEYLRRKLPDFAFKHIGTWRLTERCLRFCFDFSSWYGETFRVALPTLRWGVNVTAKRSIDLNRPVVMGHLDPRINLDCMIITEVVALKTAKGIDSGEEWISAWRNNLEMLFEYAGGVKGLPPDHPLVRAFAQD